MKSQFIYLCIIPILFSGCAVAPPKKTVEKPRISKEKSKFFKLLKNSEIPIFKDAHKKENLLKALKYNITYLKNMEKPDRTYLIGSRKIARAELLASAELFKKIIEENHGNLQNAIEKNFEIYRLVPGRKDGAVIFSSYYEPVIKASLKKTENYKYPIYSWPDDLIEVDLEIFNPKFKGEKITGRLEGKKLVPYYTREEIDFGKALEGKAKPLAWFTDPIEVMNLHIQGSGRLKLENNKEMRVKFAATNSLPFKGWISYMIEKGIMKRKGITFEKAKKFVLSHPELQKEILCSNKRYTFFELEEINDPTDGPQGTYKYPLTAKRSVAIDETLVPLGAIAYAQFKLPQLDKGGNFKEMKMDSRFVLCQDTGGAIKGPGRVDFFAGTGSEAHTFANKVWEKGAFYILLKKGIK